jgi:hypothetical protein
MTEPTATFLEEKREESILMTEFAFEGGHREGPDFLQHFEDRKKGMPRQNASLQSNLNSWGEPLGAPPPSGHSVIPLPMPRGMVGGDHGVEPGPPAKIYRMDSHGIANRGEGLVGEVPYAMVEDLLCEGVIPPSDRVRAEEHLKQHVKNAWGGGRYVVVSDQHADYDMVVSGPSKPMAGVLGQGAGPGDDTEPPEIGVGVTVWLDLSRDGPYKVVGPYSHPLGAAVPAHHPHDAPNTYETVRVVEGLWLCQDVKGVVHILAEGSLTTTPPASRFSKLNQAASWCWAKREVVLWVAIASMAAALAL